MTLSKNSSRHQVLPRLRVMRGSAIALGPGKVALLQAIEETGALAEARSQACHVLQTCLGSRRNDELRIP